MSKANGNRADDATRDTLRAEARAEAERLNTAGPGVVSLAREFDVDLTAIKDPTGPRGRIIAEDVCRASGLPADHEAYLTFIDAARAARLGMKASDFQGSGPRGEITGTDMRKEINARAQLRAAASFVSSVAAVAAGGLSDRSVEARSQFNEQTVKVDPWARNPLVDDARQAEPRFFQAAMSEGPPPKLFKSGGDLPAFMASGSDPQILLKLPWVTRHAAAKADSTKLFEMIEELSGPDGEDIAWVEQHSSDKGYIDEAANREYFQRVNDWLSGVGQDPLNPSPARQLVNDAAYDWLFPEEARKRQEEATAAAQKDAKARYDAERKRIQNEVHTIDARRGYPV